MILPVALVCIILIGAVALLLRKRRFSCTSLVTTALPAVLKAFFFLYPIIVNKAFEVRRQPVQA